MATTKEYLDFILGQLDMLDAITHRKMMGEYIIYYNEKIIAYLCDNRFLVKETVSAHEMMPDAVLEPPYTGAKNMILVTNIDDKDFLCELFRKMYPELPPPKEKKNRKAKK